MGTDAGHAHTPLWPTPGRPVILIGITDGAGDMLADLLGCHPRLCRVPRSRLLSDLATAIERNQPALAAYGLAPEHWQQAAGAFFDGLQREYAERDGRARWVAYASSASLSVAELGHLFPTAQLVHVITPPRGGAGRIVAANRRAGAGLPPGRYLEVGEWEILTDSEGCVRRVVRFIEEEDMVAADSEIVLEPEIALDLADPSRGTSAGNRRPRTIRK